MGQPLSASCHITVNNAIALRQRAMNGEFRVEMDKNEHFNKRQARVRGHRYCTRSQIIRHRDGSRTIAVMHQIRNPDGTLGASGLPDPKYLDLGYLILKLEPN